MVELDFNKFGGLIPAVVQDYKTNEVLMVAFMNKESFEETLELKKSCFYSRSRNKLWLKGETSGNVQIVKEIFVGCELDSVLLKVEQVGNAACHEGYKSCFFRRLSNGELTIISKRVFNPKQVYNNLNQVGKNIATLEAKVYEKNKGVKK